MIERTRKGILGFAESISAQMPAVSGAALEVPPKPDV